MYISVTRNAYESTPTRPFTVHLRQIKAVHVNAARLCTPHLADASRRSTATAPFNPPVPQRYRQGRRRHSDDLGDRRFGQISTCPVHGVGLCSGLAEGGSRLGQQSDQVRGDRFPKLKAPQRVCPDSACQQG